MQITLSQARQKQGFNLLCILAAAAILFGTTGTIHAQISKANLILIERGLQLQGMVQPDDNFDFHTYTNLNYTSINYLRAYTNTMESWDHMSRIGTAPGFPWGRWAGNPSFMPPLGEEAAYTNQLVSLSYSDEPNLLDSTIFDNMVNWFNATASDWPNTIRYINNWGGQIVDAPLSSFISQARPDLISFDTYPWKSVYDTNAPNSIGSPIGGPNAVLNWYGELRRYRAWASVYNIPFGIYRQTFNSVESWSSTVYRNPSASELRLNTFAALAFNAKMLLDFTYNSGATCLFDRYYFPDGSSTGAGDNYTNALYAEQRDINLRARNLGKALVRLKPVSDLHNTNTISPPPGPGSDDPNFSNGYTTSIMFLRGKYMTGDSTNFTPIPNSFLDDPSSSTNFALRNSLAYTWWESGKNDPYLTGFSVTNTAAVKNNGLHGDAIISWFRPLDESMDGPNFTNQIYMMVVNALSDLSGTPADCLQEIKLDFSNLTGAMTNLIMLNPATGQLQTNGLPSVSGKRRLTLSLNGGDAALFKFNTGAPFVGFYPTQPASLAAQVQTNPLTINIQGTVGSRYEVQISDSLSSTNWTTLNSFLLPSSPHSFQDTTTSNASNRFYRVVAAP